MNRIYSKIFPSKEMKSFRKMRRRHRKELIKHAKDTREWDWSWLHDSVIMQIQHMYEYYSAGNNVWQDDTSRLDIVRRLKEVLDINQQIKDIQEAPFYHKPHPDCSSYIELPNGCRMSLKESQERETQLYRELYSSIGQNIEFWWD
jgi:hypothetical protein